MSRIRNRKTIRIRCIIYCAIFLFMLLCNVLTPYMVDDFDYQFSFMTDERMEHFSDILPSMIGHAYRMNGRLVAHSLVQLFVLMPTWVFDIVNSAVFCLLVKLLSNITRQNEDTNLMQIAVFCGMWMYCPAFGQVNLWQDGAVNYLWSAVVGLLFLAPFISRFLNGKVPAEHSLAGQCGLVLFAYLAGAYSETVSAAAIFMATALMILDVRMNDRKASGYLITVIVVAVLGYISIYVAPAQRMNKGAPLVLTSLINSFINITLRYKEDWPLLILTVVLFVINVAKESDPKKVALAVVLFLGALAANYIMVFARYYSPRSATGATVLHIAANVVLTEAISWDKEYRMKCVCVMAVLILLTVPELLVGARSINSTWVNMNRNEQLILECKENGIMNVEVPVFWPENGYSGLHDLKYLDTEDVNTWPNKSMAKYYGVDSIIGVYE